MLTYTHKSWDTQIRCTCCVNSLGVYSGMSVSLHANTHAHTQVKGTHTHSLAETRQTRNRQKGNQSAPSVSVCLCKLECVHKACECTTGSPHAPKSLQFGCWAINSFISIVHTLFYIASERSCSQWSWLGETINHYVYKPALTLGSITYGVMWGWTLTNVPERGKSQKASWKHADMQLSFCYFY